jgi:hypothetical protein
MLTRQRNPHSDCADGMLAISVVQPPSFFQRVRA